MSILDVMGDSDDFVPTSCDCCGRELLWKDTQETGSFGLTGRMCLVGSGCNVEEEEQVA